MKLVLALTLAASVASAAAPISTSLALTIHGKTTMLTTAHLRAMPQVETKVHDAHADETYRGVRLDVLLARYGLPDDETTHEARLHGFVVATGSDRYWALYSVTEVESAEHDGDVLVALTKDGKPLTTDGELKLISSGDKRAHRWVRNLSAITVRDAAP